MTDILTMREYSRYSLDELVDMLKALENRVAELEDNCDAKDRRIAELEVGEEYIDERYVDTGY